MGSASSQLMIRVSTHASPPDTPGYRYPLSFFRLPRRRVIVDDGDAMVCKSGSALAALTGLLERLAEGD
jgi:hypothetical protein